MNLVGFLDRGGLSLGFPGPSAPLIDGAVEPKGAGGFQHVLLRIRSQRIEWIGDDPAFVIEQETTGVDLAGRSLEIGRCGHIHSDSLAVSVGANESPINLAPYLVPFRPGIFRQVRGSGRKSLAFHLFTFLQHVDFVCLDMALDVRIKTTAKL